MNFILEVVGVIVLCCFVLAACGDNGLSGEINGKKFCVAFAEAKCPQITKETK